MQTLAGLINSKKFITFLTTMVVAYAARKGLNLDPELVAAFVGLGAATIVGFGLQDHGKEAAKIQASTTTTTTIAPPGDTVVETKEAPP